MTHLDALLLHPLFEGIDPSQLAACSEAITVNDVSRGTLLNTPSGRSLLAGMSSLPDR